MYVCVYVCMYMHICIYQFADLAGRTVCMYMYVHKPYMNVCIYASMNVYMKNQKISVWNTVASNSSHLKNWLEEQYVYVYETHKGPR